ncbi:MAG TPA: glycosyltransferase family 87 protein [Aeromicrobium sp.]|nr:glycosyltransferase family 87 protein [Aeromicrobium sp.]
MRADFWSRTSGRARSVDERFPALLWVALLLAHAWPLAYAFVTSGDSGVKDPLVYWAWFHDAANTSVWPLIDTTWVYPPGAYLVMLPLLAVGAGSVSTLYWVLLTLALNVVVLLRLRQFDSRGRAASWWWVACIGLTGALAVSRLESVIAPMTFFAVTFVGSRPKLMVVLLSLAGWIKLAPWVWLPALVLFRRIGIVTAGLLFTAVSAVVFLPFLVLGGWANATSFLSSQTGRGLQAESFWALPFQFAHAIGVGEGPTKNKEIVTYEFAGAGTSEVAAIANLALPVLVFGALALIAVVAWRARSTDVRFDLVAASAAILTVALILGNKVGSPQFMLWLAPVIASAILFAEDSKLRRSWAVWGLILAFVTQIQYPIAFESVLAGGPVGTIALFARYVCVFAITWLAIRVLIRSLRPQPTSARRHPQP